MACLFANLLAAGLALTGSSIAWAYNPSERTVMTEKTPAQLEGLGIDEHLGDRVDLDLSFRDEAGALVPLKSFFSGIKPVLLTIVYYDCPGLCNYHLNGVTAALKQVDWSAGDKFELVAVSMDPKETPELADLKKKAYLKEYNRPEAEKGWHFLTGTEENIQKLARQVGFKYRWDDIQQQYAHASVAYVITPDGRISRYLYGIEFAPQTLRLSLIEGSSGKIGTLVDQLILFCFHFDPAQNKYVLYAFNVMRGGALLIVVAIALILIPAWRRERRRTKLALKGEG